MPFVLNHDVVTVHLSKFSENTEKIFIFIYLCSSIAVAPNETTLFLFFDCPINFGVSSRLISCLARRKRYIKKKTVLTKLCITMKCYLRMRKPLDVLPICLERFSISLVHIHTI